MKAYCIGSEEVVKGFELIGVEGIAPAEGDDVGAIVERTLNDPEIGLLLISDRLAVPLHETLTEWTFDHQQPLILEIPDERGPLTGHSRVLSLVMESVGLGQAQ